MVQAVRADLATPPTNGSAAKLADGRATVMPTGSAALTDGDARSNGVQEPAQDVTMKEAGENGKAAELDPEEAAKAKEAEALRQREDEVAAKGAEIAGVRALLARAFVKPGEEPERPKSHWTYLLEEMIWLAVDFTQERLWRRTAALALAYDIAKKKGNFGLKPPPKEFRRYSDEIAELRAAALGPMPPAPTGGAVGRRSSARATANVASTTAGSPSQFLALDPACDPIFADIELGGKDLMDPGTPPLLDDLTVALAFPCDEEFVATLNKTLMDTEVDRLIREESVYRSAKLEYEAALVSHQLAVAEAHQAANNIIGDLGLGPGFGVEAEEGDGFGAVKKSGKRRKGAARGASGGGFLGLQDFGDEDDVYGKRSASRAAMVEDVYLRKKRPTRTPAYRDADADYDITMDAGVRYSTRRATGALQRTQGPRGAGDRRRGAPGGRADAYQQATAARARAQAGMPGMAIWTKPEEELLLAVVHEFGVNWTLVSEVLSLSLGMQGIHRPPGQCRQRFRQLTMQEGHDYSEERAHATLSVRMSKQEARQLLNGSLPVQIDVLQRLLEALVQVGASAKSRRAMQEKQNEAQRMRRQEMHASYVTIITGLMQQTGGRHLSPVELAAHVNNTYLAQARQQQLMAQQAQAAAAMQAQHQNATHAAVSAAQQQQQQQQQPQHLGGQQIAGVSAQHQQQQASPQLPLQAQPQHPPGAVPPGQGPPPSQLGHGLPHGLPQQQQQQQQQGPPHPPGAPLGMPPGSLPASAMPLQQPGGPPAPGKPVPPPPQITLQQLNTILASNKLPNGQELTDDMRKAIEAKRASYIQQISQQQAAAAQRQQALAAGAAQGQPPTTAAMALQGGGRPPLQAAAVFAVPPNGALPLPPGMSMQMTQLPPGVSAAQLAVSGGIAIPGGQHGMMLPPQQQQLLAQQALMQQQQQQVVASPGQHKTNV